MNVDHRLIGSEHVLISVLDDAGNVLQWSTFAPRVLDTARRLTIPLGPDSASIAIRFARDPVTGELDLPEIGGPA